LALRQWLVARRGTLGLLCGRQLWPLEPFFVILARDGYGRLLKLGKGASTKEELWAGRISNENDIDILMSFVAAARGER
jgi:hypothetical protein